MKVLCWEIPLPTKTFDDGTLDIVIGDSPSVQLLSLAAAAAKGGALVELLPSSSSCAALLPSQPDPSRSALAERIRSVEADVVVVNVNSFNWPLASAALTLLTVGDAESRPTVIIAGPHATMFSTQIFDSEVVDACIFDGYEAVFTQLLQSRRDGKRKNFFEGVAPMPGVVFRNGLGNGGQRGVPAGFLTQLSQMPEWPRWDKGLSCSEVLGFELQSQPHSSNFPEFPSESNEAVVTWLENVFLSLDTFREPCLWLSSLSGIWGRGLMDVLGGIAYRSTTEHGFTPALGIRGAPEELMANSVLPSLAVLEVKQLDVLAGTPAPTSLQPNGNQVALDQLNECVKEIKHCGLASKTRLVSVVGLPGETAAGIMEKVRYLTSLAVENSLAELKFEWWYNVPGSPLYQPLAAWENLINDTSAIWFLRENLFDNLPNTLDSEGRSTVVVGIEFMRNLHENLKIRGPFIF
jgi:hypothetical protein